MSVPEEKVPKSGMFESRTDVMLMPTTIRMPKDIYDALPNIVLYEHKTSVSDLLREWVVDSAAKFLRNPTYQRWLRTKEVAESRKK